MYGTAAAAPVAAKHVAAGQGPLTAVSAATAYVLMCCVCLLHVWLQGIKLGVSSRGWASVVTDPHSKQVVVEPDYQLITFDFVPEPSNAGAYVVPICKRYRCDITQPFCTCLLFLWCQQRATALGSAPAA